MKLFTPIILMCLTLSMWTENTSYAQSYGIERILQRSSLVVRAKVDSIGYVTVPGTSQQHTKYTLCNIQALAGTYSGSSCMDIGSFGSFKPGSFHSPEIPNLIVGKEYILFIKDNTNYAAAFEKVFTVEVVNSIEYVTTYSGSFIQSINQDTSWKLDENKVGLKYNEFKTKLDDIVNDMVANGLAVPTGLPTGWKWVYDP